METQNIFDRIKIDPRVMLGKPVFAGTRIPVYIVLNLLAEGQPEDEILNDYPDLESQDIRTAMRFASLLATFEEPYLNGVSRPQYA